jgi:hypothetical protein
MLTGCHPSAKRVFKVPPSLQTASYVDAGSTLEWVATGEPFEIYWTDDRSPCWPPAVESMKSDGTQDVVCHAYKLGGFQYQIGKPGLTDEQRQARYKECEQCQPPVTIGPFPMRVVSCAGCGFIQAPPPDQSKFKPAGKATPVAEVDVSCPADAPSTTITTVKPLSASSGTATGGFVEFQALVDTQPGVTPMTITFPHGVCTNGDSIAGGQGYCILSPSVTSPVKYTVQANQCAVNANPTLQFK